MRWMICVTIDAHGREYLMLEICSPLSGPTTLVTSTVSVQLLTGREVSQESYPSLASTFFH